MKFRFTYRIGGEESKIEKEYNSLGEAISDFDKLPEIIEHRKDEKYVVLLQIKNLSIKA